VEFRSLRSPIIIGLGLFLGLAVFFLLSEKIQAYDGMGYDGVHYVSIARAPYQFFLEARSDYLFQRFLPSVIVGIPLRPFADPVLAPQDLAITGFALWNALCIGLSAYWLIKSCRLLGMRDEFIAFTLVGLLGSFSLLKFPAYYPVLTDVTAFAEGCALLHAFLARRLIWMMIAFLCVFFTWPSAVFPATGVLIFQRIDVRDNGGGLSRAWRVGIAILGAAGLCAASYHRLRAGNYIAPGGMTTQPLMKLLPVSYAVLALYLGTVFTVIAISTSVSVVRIWSSLRVGALIGALLLIGFFPVVRDYLFQPISNMASVGDFALWAILTHGIVAPGKFVVANIMYFGPLLLIAALLWRQIAQLAAGQGYGLVALLALGAAQGIETESRHLMFYWPFVGVLASRALQDRVPHLSAGALLAFGAICLLISRVWLPIGGHPYGKIPDPQNSFADQRFFMTQGPWLTHEFYVVQLIVVVVLALLLITAIHKGHRSDGKPPSRYQRAV
jgi:hypothetical protein